jgi:hypothetical protein
MGDAGRFALAIAILVFAFIAMFFAFHPGGVEGVTNPVEMLNWLINEFNSAGTSASATPASNAAASLGPQNAGAAPTETGA